MVLLKYLNASGDCGIGNDGIVGINPEKLCLRNNIKITKISHMSNLKKLIASGLSGLTNDEISGLNVEMLDISHN